MFDKDVSHVRIRACRTLDEAFPTGAHYGCAIEKPVTTGERLLDVAFAIVIGVCLALALVSWWSS